MGVAGNAPGVVAFPCSRPSGALSPQLLLQPRARERPVVVDGARRNTESFGALGDREATEHAHVDDSPRAFVELGQGLDRVVDLDQVELAAHPEARLVGDRLGGDTAAVSELHHHIETAAKPLGIEREKRGFTPHITLGRIRSDFGALALVDAMRKLGEELNSKPFTPTELVLYRSVLRPSGAEHRALVRRVVPKPAPGA